MNEFINSPEVMQLLVAHPKAFAMLAVIAGAFIVCAILAMPRWFTITHHHYPAPSTNQDRHPFADLPPGYYYLDAIGRAQSVTVQEPTVQQPAPADAAPQQPSKSNNRPKMSKSKRFRILRRDGFRCKMCGRGPDDGDDVKLHIDHKMPLSKGGGNDEENLWTLCDACNGAKSDTIMEELFDDEPDGEKESA